MTNQPPKISVLMPVWNTPEPYLRETIDSILAQTFTDFEFIILNDCSTDPNVEKVVSSYADPRIIYVTNEKNLGISGTRNRLLALARGEYLAIMDHDDISLPERFAKQVQHLDSQPLTGVVGGYFANQMGGKVMCYAEHHSDILLNLMVGMPMCHPCMMIRRTVLEEHGIYYHAEYSPAEDYHLLVQLIGKTQFHNIPQVLFQYRNHATNTSHLQADKMESATIAIHVILQTEHPALWNMAHTALSSMTRVRLFKVLPLWTIIKTRRQTSLLLFGSIPILSWRTKRAFIV